MAPDGRPSDGRRRPGPARPAAVERLANGLTVCLLTNGQAPVVTTALWYRAGSRDEPAGQGGIAHFLEHLMFKGSARYGPGEIDRRTQALGGANNAFTSHDATAYHFNFARDRWREALAIEADRMAGLTLDPGEVAAERQVILEEIAMYESEPWDALGMAVEAATFPGHPYGRPVLGSRAPSSGHRPGRAGRLPPPLLPPRQRRAGGGGRPRRRRPWRRSRRPSRGRRPAIAAAAAGARRRRRRSAGAAADRAAARARSPVALLALRGPAADHPDRPVLHLRGGPARRRSHQPALPGLRRRGAALLVGVGRPRRDGGRGVVRHRDGAGAGGGAGAGRRAAARRAGGAGRRRRGDGAAALPDEELERARRVLFADWVFAHERVHQQALVAGLQPGPLRPRPPRPRAARGPRRRPRARARGRRPLSAGPSGGAVLGWSLPRAAADGSLPRKSGAAVEPS